MPIIQINFNCNCSLAEYYVKIKSWKIEFPDFSDYCPICYGKDCPQFLCFYFREAVDERGIFYKALPIARFLCTRKGFKNGKDRTFSLLPSQLIPYSKYSIPFVTKIMKAWHLEGKSIKEKLDYLSEMESKGIVCIGVSTLCSFQRVFRTAVEKILTTGFFPKIHRYLNIPDSLIQIRNFIAFLSGEYEGHSRDPCNFAHQFYLWNGGIKNNSSFLFGTPSQFRV